MLQREGDEAGIVVYCAAASLSTCVGVSVYIYCAEASLWVVTAALERTRTTDEIVIGGGSHVTLRIYF